MHDMHEQILAEVSGESHFSFCKQQALAVLEVNGIGDAWANLVINLKKHPETNVLLKKKYLVSVMVVGIEGMTKEKFARYITNF